MKFFKINLYTKETEKHLYAELLAFLVLIITIASSNNINEYNDSASLLWECAIWVLGGSIVQIIESIGVVKHNKDFFDKERKKIYIKSIIINIIFYDIFIISDYTFSVLRNMNMIYWALILILIIFIDRKTA